MSETIISIRHGAIQGEQVGDVRRFLGIPYAEPPVKHLRFRPPREPQPWSGIRDARKFGPIAPQNGEPFSDDDSAAWYSLDGGTEAFPQNEDCLTLNVWTAAKHGNECRPVMVWFHGGGLRSGTGRLATYDGEVLARDGVVLVTVNYRLGILGYLCHPDLADDSGPAGNWGLLDQLAALDWVRQNIAAFGGDPKNVTVFGQSAGGSSIATMFATPERRPFDKAILQSAAPKATPFEDAVKLAEQVASFVEVNEVTDLRKTPVAEILKAQQAIEGPGSPMVFIIAVDGHLFTKPPLDLIRERGGLDVPRLIGTVRDEWRRFLTLDRKALTMDDAALRRRIERVLPGDPDAVITAYRDHRRARGETVEPHQIWYDISGDAYFRLPGRAFERATEAFTSPAYAYLLDAPSRFDNGRYGTFHCFELPLVFGTWSKPEFAPLYGDMPDAAATSELVREVWTTFAGTGNPATEATGPWPRLDGQTGQVMVLGSDPHVEAKPFDNVLDLVSARITSQQTTRPLGV